MVKLITRNPYDWFKVSPGKPKKYRSFTNYTNRDLTRLLINDFKKSNPSVSKYSGLKEPKRSQNSIIKASYLRNKYPNQWAAHGRYLQRKGAQKEDEIGLGFNAERDDIQIAKELHLWQNSGTADLAVLEKMTGIKGTILDPNDKKSIWVKVSDTEVRLKTDISVTKNAVRDMSKGDFDNVWTMIQQARNGGDERLWKIILSPEAGDKVNLKEHAIKFMEQVQKDLGRKLEWIAIDHYNTDQYHLHFCIRGVDLDGFEVRIDKGYIKEGARKISKQLLTQKLGLRTDDYIIERRAKSVTLEHITELDRILERELKLTFQKSNIVQSCTKGQEILNDLIKKGVVEETDGSETRIRSHLIQKENLVREIAQNDFDKVWAVLHEALYKDNYINVRHGSNKKIDQELRLQKLARLEFLESMNLAKKHNSALWTLDPTFLDTLKYHQEKNDIQKTLNKHKDNVIDQHLPLTENDLPNIGDRVIGRVIGTGLNERNEDLRYIIVEGIDGIKHYVTAPTSILKLRDNHQLSKGDFVCMEKTEFEKPDGQKIPYIKAEAYTDPEMIRVSTEVTDIDRYIIDKLIYNGQVPEAKPTDNWVRKEFLKVVEHRINYMRSRHILNDKLEVSIENLRRNMRRQL